MRTGGDGILVLITYDVNTQNKDGIKRLNKISKLCVNYGQRVQNSVFECLIESADFVNLKDRLCSTMDLEKDSIRFYYLGKNYDRKIEHYGTKKTYEPEGLLLV